MLTNELKLKPIDTSNWREALSIRTSPDQLKYVADYEPVALVILSKSYVRVGGADWYPLAITEGDSMVGIVAIAHLGTRCEIFHLVIDRAEQGRGLGKASVVAIVEYIRARWPQCDSVALTVHPNNDPAKSIYIANGFLATGETRDSEPVLKLSI